MAESVVYSQSILVTLTRVDLDYRCDIAATATVDDAAWTVTATRPTRGAALQDALAQAKHQMRLEVNEA